jgi:Holliday junction resolvasome RuvABC endonuclease subunit
LNILALDLATRTGWCCNEGSTIASSAFTLCTEKELREDRKDRYHRRSDLRIQNFFKWLTSVKLNQKPDAVVFEDVEFHTSLYQTQLWASLRTAVWCSFPRDKFVVDCLSVSALKEFATGSKSATKEAMRRYLKDPRFDKPSLIDDNEVDAIWLWLWAEKTLTRLKK